MLNRVVVSLGLVLAAFAATTGVSSAAIETQSEVMYLTAAVVVVFLVIVSIVAALKHSLGLDKMAPPDPNESFGHHAAADDHSDDHAADDHGDAAPAVGAGAHGAH